MQKPVLIIDNHDSFTFNLYQMVAEVAGQRPVVIRNDESGNVDFSAFDRIVISPGPGTPENSADFGISRRAFQQTELPVLGVCLGHQGLGHEFGSRVVRAPEPVHGRISRITHNGDPLFAGMPPTFDAVRYHSLMLAAPLPNCFEVLAWTEDNLIMAIRHIEKPFWGVQFHPESICSQMGGTLLANFCQFSTERRADVPQPRRYSPKPTEPINDLRLRSRKLDRLFDAEAVFVRLFANEKPAFWLDSSLVAKGRSRFSFIGGGASCIPRELRYRSSDACVNIRELDGQDVYNGTLFDYLRRELSSHGHPDEGLPFSFQGGYVGYLGYELKADAGAAQTHDAPLPDSCLLYAKRFLVFDHEEHATYLCGLTSGDSAADGELEAWFDNMERNLNGVTPVTEPNLPVSREPLQVRLRRSQQTYMADIQRCLEEIRAGETYEVCLTNQLEIDSQVPGLDFYRILRRRNPAPYAAFLQWADFSIACSSPERFLHADADGLVESKPIKGTRPRGPTQEADQALIQDLRENVKDRAENLMIVDLVRNDLGRTCEVGSVHVPKLMAVESYATVHQLVSTVRGQLRADTSIVDCIRAAFPGGSMTGAPKERTMRILDEIEGSARGVYSGSIGYLSFNQAIDLNIVIRTAVIADNHYTIGVGGAIIALSEPDDEYHEMLLKSKALLGALSEATHGNARSDLVNIDEGQADTQRPAMSQVISRRHCG